MECGKTAKLIRLFTLQLQTWRRALIFFPRSQTRFHIMLLSILYLLCLRRFSLFLFLWRQALHMIPRIPTLSSKNLRVSSLLPRSSSVSSRLSVSRVFLNHSDSNFGFAIDSRKRREFIAKAEESTEGETEAVVENVVETGEEEDGEATAAEEAKSPRKPRIKLGDIMGVS